MADLFFATLKGSIPGYIFIGFDKTDVGLLAPLGRAYKVVTEQERELAEKVKRAHSIIDPYLTELEPRVNKVFQGLNVPTMRRYVGYGSNTRAEDLGYWSFMCAADGDSGDQGITLYSSGKFASGVGLIDGSSTEFLEGISPMYSRLFANLDDQKVYVSRKRLGYPHQFDPSQLQELGEFLAHYIHKYMVK